MRYARLLLLSPVPLLGLMVGAFALTSPFTEVDYLFGVVLSSIGTLGLVCFALLYLPVATWLRVGEGGITYCVGFRRRDVAWNRVRELRIVSMDRTILRELVIEVVPASAGQPNGGGRPASWRIDAKLFGWSPDALAQEMDAWRARYVTA